MKGLADVALDEWRLKPGDARLESPRRAWAPVLPPVAEIAPDARRLGRTVSGQADISTDGRVASARIDERSGDERVDFAVERWVREGRWRPAVRERKYVRSSTRWSVELR